MCMSGNLTWKIGDKMCCDTDPNNAFRGLYLEIGELRADWTFAARFRVAYDNPARQVR